MPPILLKEGVLRGGFKISRGHFYGDALIEFIFMKGLLAYVSCCLAGFTFGYACGLSVKDALVSGLASGLFSIYRGMCSKEVSPWLLFFGVSVLFGVGIFEAIAAGPIAALCARSFSSDVSFLGIKCHSSRRKDPLLVNVILSLGWGLLGYMSRMEAIFILTDRSPVMLDPGRLIAPFSLIGPLALVFFMPSPSSGSATPEEGEINFVDLSRIWRQEAGHREDGKAIEEGQAQDVFQAGGVHRDVLNRFWSRYVAPFSAVIEEFDLVQPLLRVMVMLDRHGDVPSVRQSDYRDRNREKNQYDILAGVPLAIHSVHVAQKVVEAIKERFPENASLYLPGVLMAALAHDLGKLEVISGRRYVTGQHPTDGANLLTEEIMKGHPWADKVAELVRRHHEAVVDRTPVELAMLIRADKAARAMEVAGGSPAPGKDDSISSADTGSYPPKVEQIPDGFPLERLCDRIREVTNVMLPNRTWVSFSQPDGVVYVQAETLHETISALAQEVGLDDPFFHATDRDTKKSCLQSFYEEFRKRGWVPERLVGPGFYGNFFWVWNPVGRKKIRTFYMPLKAEALRAEPVELEAERNTHAILASVKVLGVALPEKRH